MSRRQKRCWAAVDSVIAGCRLATRPRPRPCGGSCAGPGGTRRRQRRPRAARRRTYLFALEQAEQKFRATVGTDVATRRLLALTGWLSPPLQPRPTEAGENWKATGSLAFPIRCAARCPQSSAGRKRRGHWQFARLSEVLDSRCGGGGTARPDQLWDLLPDNRLTPLDDAGQSRWTPPVVPRLRTSGPGDYTGGTSSAPESSSLYQVSSRASAPISRYPRGSSQYRVSRGTCVTSWRAT